MQDFIFDLQRFDAITIPAGETYELDGVTYTAVTDAVFNLDDGGKISGLASGKVTAGATGKTNPQLTVDATNNAATFTLTGDGENLTLSKLLNFKLTNGEFNLTGNVFTAAAGSNATLFGQLDSNASFENMLHFDKAETYIFTSTAFSTTTEQSTSKFSVTVGGKTNSLTSVQRGTVINNFTERGFTLTDESSITATIGNYTLTATATDGDAGGNIQFGTNGITFTPNANDGKLNVAVNRDGNEIISGELECTNGSITIGYDNSVSLAKDTSFTFTRGDYTFTATATDDASAEISLSDNGITFTPKEGDGNLKISVTRDGKTRTASLDMTGSLTYKLDGSITLAKGTVLKSFFEDGRLLTVTANSDASGSMIFSPQDGLIITLATPDALSVLLSADGKDIIKLAAIDGTVTYSGGTFTASDGTEIRFVDPAGIYNDNVLRTAGGSTSLNFSTERIIYTANEGATFTMDYLQGTTWELQNGSITDYFSGETQGLLSLSEGSTFDTNDNEYPFTLKKEGNYMLNSIPVTTTSDNVDALFSNYETVTIAGISYTPLDDNVMITTDDKGATVSGGKVSMEMDGFGKSLSFDVTDGSISYDSTTNKFSVTAGAKSLINGGDFPDQFVAKNNFGVTVQKNSDGTFTFSTDDSAAVAIERNGNAIMGTTITLDGSVIIDPTNKQVTVPKGTTVTMTPGDDKILQVTALDDAGGTLSLVNGGIRFEPNKNDGALEFNFVNSERKVQLDVTGAFTYRGLGALSLEDGTEVNLSWEDGNQLKLTSHGSTGSIGIDPTRGLRITSNDENLDMTFSTPSMSTDLSGIKGTIYYNAGVISFDENSKITATTTLGGQPMLTTLETLGGTGHISFNTTNGVIYAADTGALKVTWSRGDLESTFIVNEGSVQLGHNLFRIAEGSDIATDLKNFVPAFYFTTDEAGNYTINGQTITTSAANLALTATDDYMTFHTSDDVVTYDGMTFAGDGNVSLTADNVVLGAGVVANGFGEGNSFVLAEAGNVTADAKIFQLDPLSLTDGREIPMVISVTGAQDGFIFSRTLTEESEEYLGEIDSPYVGSIFTEKFISKGDNSYRIRTDPIGLEDVIGISDGATISGGATLDDEETLSYYVLVTDTTGDFTIGEKTYTIAKGSKLGTGIRARFDVGTEAYADKITDLNGTISGDFSEGQFSVNGSAAMQVFDDTDVSISADKNGFEIFGLDKGASLSVSAAGNYVVNSTSIAAQAGNVIVGLDENAAAILVNDTVITGTEKADVLTNAGKNVSIMALGGEDSITNTGANAYVDGGDDEDWIKNYGDSSTIIGGQAKDSITNSGDNVTISGDTGKDSIVNKGDNVSISGGKGKDSIVNTGDNVTINGGTGDDEITDAGDNVLIQYTAGDGSDLIYGFNENSTLNISGKGYIPATVGNDLILTVGYDAITLKDAASLTTANIVGTIDTSHEPEEILKNTVGLNIDKLDKVEVTDSESLDAATSDGSKVLEIADGVKDVDLSGSDYPQVVSLTGGNQNLEFNDAGENAAIVGEDATGWKNITFGKGDDVGIFKSSQTVNRVSLGAGDDSIFVDNGAKVRVDMSGADAAKIVPWSGKVTLENYDASTGAGFVTDYADILEAINDGEIYFDAGQMSVGSAVVNFNGVTGGVVNFFDAAGKLQKFGQAAPNESLDLSAETSNFILVADKNSTLTSGTGDDTIFAFTGSLVNAGAGKNSIYIEERDENSSGTKINLDGGGNDTVHNFKTGFDFGSDAIYSDGGLTVRLRLYDENLVASVNGGAQVTLEGVAKDGADFAEILLAMPDSTTKVAVAKAGGVIKSQDAQMYIGNKEDKGSGVDFSGTTEKLFVNLSDEPIVTDAGEKQFYGINYVVAGDGVSTLIGNSEKNTLVAGNGYGSLWGGADDDNLIGKADSSIKNGMTSFFFFAGDGNDTVSNFEFITRENKISGNADKIAITADIVTRASLSGDDVVMQLNDGDDYLTLEDAAGKDFRLNDLIVKVDKNISYDGLANCYVADGGSSLTVDSTVDSAEIWLDSSHGNFFFGNIRTLDASAVEGRTSLAGYVLDETIIAGHGDSSLWGGNDGNDLLIGGESKNTFFYHLGNGNDTIQGAKEGDIVDLNTITINQVVGEIGDGGVVLRFTDGGSLTVDNTNVEFRINNDGTTYVVENGEWKTK